MVDTSFTDCSKGEVADRCTNMCFQVDHVAAFLQVLELCLAGVGVDGPDALHQLLRVLLHTTQLEHDQQQIAMTITFKVIITNMLRVFRYCQVDWLLQRKRGEKS